jgi:hypothetical protein
MYNFKKIAQEIQLDDFQKLLYKEYQREPDECLRKLGISNIDEINNINIDDASLRALYMARRNFDETTSPDLAATVLNKITSYNRLTTQYIDLNDSCYNEGFYLSLIKKLNSYSMEFVVTRDEKLAKLLPNVYRDFLYDVLSEYINKKRNLYDPNQLFKMIASNNIKLNINMLIYLFFNEDGCNFEYTFSNNHNVIMKILFNNIDLKDDLIKHILNLPSSNPLYVVWPLFQNYDFSHKYLNYNEFKLIFFHLLDKYAPVNFGTLGTLLKETDVLKEPFFTDYFCQDFYNALKETNNLYILKSVMNEKSFINQFSFIDPSEVNLSSLLKGYSYDGSFDDMNKAYTEIIDLLEKNKDIKQYFNILSNYSDAKREYSFKILENKYKNPEAEIILEDLQNSIYNFSGYHEHNYYNFIAKNNEELINGLEDIENKINEIIGLLNKEFKNMEINNDVSFVISDFIKNGILNVDKRDYRKIINNSIEEFCNEHYNDGEKYKEYIYSLGNFIYSWGTTRLFGKKDNNHDTWILFTTEETIKQPMVTSFLQKEMYTDVDILTLLLALRHEAINNRAILPGKERPEELQEKYYPDNRKGLFEYKANIKIGENHDEIKTKMIVELSPYSSDELIKKFVNRIKIPEQKYIQTDEVNINGFTFKILDKNDPLGSVLGNITKCCQIVGGAGEECVIDGYNNPMSGFLAVLEKNKVISQSWLRIGKSKTLYLDNIETVSNFDENYKGSDNFMSNDLGCMIKINYFDVFENFKKTDINSFNNKNKINLLKESYISWSKYIKEKTDQNGNKLFSGVVVGGTFNDLNFHGKEYDTNINFNMEFGNSSSIYSDLRANINYKLAFNLRRKKKLF